MRPSGQGRSLPNWIVIHPAANGPQAAGRSITNNQPRQSGADIVAIALSFFKLSQSESGDAETKKREGGGSGAADEFSVDPFTRT
jgi:hypothetical protein